MQPNLIGAEAIGHRTRFAWLALALASAIALLAAVPRSDAPEASPAVPLRDVPAARAIEQPPAVEIPRTYRCGGDSRLDAERRARREAERAERRARLEAERAERRARLYR